MKGHSKHLLADDRLDRRREAAPMRLQPHRGRLSEKVGARATGAVAVGTMALGSAVVGAIAIGALAIGAVAIGRLAVGRTRLRRVEIDELVVRRLRIVEQLEIPDARDPAKD